LGVKGVAAVLLCMLLLKGDKSFGKTNINFLFSFWKGLFPSSRNGRATEFPELIKTESA
jgi:hypothetical protein